MQIKKVNCFKHTVECHLSWDFRYPEMLKKLMDEYTIVFRWLAQVGGASSCITETTLAAALKPLGQLQYYSYTYCVPAVFFVILK